MRRGSAAISHLCSSNPRNPALNTVGAPNRARERGARPENTVRRALVAGRYLLHGPPVAIGIAEEDESDVVERVCLRTGILA
jgi:hypothetical protein